jgi:hypothetical protein
MPRQRAKADTAPLLIIKLLPIINTFKVRVSLDQDNILQTLTRLAEDTIQ